MKHNWTNFRNIDPSELTLYTPRALRNNQLKDYWFNNIDLYIKRCYKVPIFKIIEFMDIRYKEVQSPGWSGAVSVNNKKAYIWVDKELSIDIKSFMCAQMLGYLLLSNKVDNFEYSSWYTKFPTKSNKKYWHFATDLLIPQYLFNTLYKIIPTSAPIPIKIKLQGLYNKEIREQNKKIQIDYKKIILNIWRIY